MFKSVVPNLFGTRPVSWKTTCPRRRGWPAEEGMIQMIIRAMGGAADEALLSHPPLTSCCAARFLTGHRPVLVRGPGVGDPGLNHSFCQNQPLSRPNRRHCTLSQSHPKTVPKAWLVPYSCSSALTSSSAFIDFSFIRSWKRSRLLVPKDCSSSSLQRATS